MVQEADEPENANSWTEAVLHFWFEELNPEDWFGGEAAIDEKIRRRFGQLYRDLKKAPPSPGDLSATQHLAAILVFDQFSRNLYRASPEAFATDALAVALAANAVALGFDALLPRVRRQFIYMPFMHSESKEMQANSIALFDGLGLPAPLGYARKHSEIIERFGRFPHRNRALGRVSTADERDFLAREPDFS